MRLDLSKGDFNWANGLALFCGMLGVTLGIVVLLGWYLHMPTLVQLRLDWVPMQYNTALCFFIASCSLLSAVLGQTRVPLIGGVFVVVVGLLSGLQYGIDKNFGIDQLLFTHDILVNTSSPGRMAPNTAMCFILLGWAIALMGFRVRRGQPSSVAIMLASLTVGLALVALAGYVTGLESAYGWGQFTSMAVHTAMGFAALGLGVTVFHWPHASAEGVDVSSLTGVLVSVTTLGVLLIVMLAAAIGLIPFYDQVRDTISEQVSERLEGEVGNIQRLLSQTTGLADILGDNDGLREKIVGTIESTPAQRERFIAALERVNSWPGPGTAYLGMLQPKGAGILARDVNNDLKLTAAPGVVTEAIARGVRGESGIVSSNSDRTMLAFFSPIRGSSWVVVSAVPAQELYAEADKKLLLISMIVMLVALSGAFGMARLMQPLTSGILMHSEELQRRVREATKDLEESLEDLEEKNRELQEFSYVVSHDLQAPLRGIAGFASLLERKHSETLGEEGKEYLGFIRQGVDQMTGFIQGFLKLSRLGSRSQPMVAVDLNQVFENICEQMRYALDHEDAALTAANLPTVVADAAQMQQLFQNLIDNAVKFRNPGKPLKISVSAQPQAERWRIAVSDNGTGVTKEESELIFKMFHRASTTEDKPGSGIGLALCARIVQRHGGNLEVENTPGGGASFVFSLPGVEADIA